MIVHKCERCGNNITVSKSGEIPEIQCSHCNRKYVVDKKTKRRAAFIVAFFVFFLAFAVSIVAALLKISPYILLIPTMILSFFIYKWALLLLAKMSRVSYDAVN